MSKIRALNTATLDQAARDYAGQWFLPTQYSRNDPSRPTMGRDWVLDSFFRADFKDEFDYLLPRFRAQLGPDALAEFDKAAAAKLTPRDAALLEHLLETKLAIRPDGSYIPGKLVTTQIGTRLIGERPKVLKLKKGREVTIMKKVFEPVYSGDRDFMGSVGALAMNISAEAAILALDALVDNFESEASTAVIKGYTGSQPLDPDAATTGTLLFTLSCAATAFGAASDQGGTVDAVAAAIGDDTSADATDTLGYVRASASADGSAETDPQIDGEAGTSGADFNFNTLAIVSGATVSMTAWTITLDQGTSAT